MDGIAVRTAKSKTASLKSDIVVRQVGLLGISIPLI